MKLFGFEFYNPRKPHIIKDGHGHYWVRVKSLSGWKYWDNFAFYYMKRFVVSYSDLETVQGALINAREYKSTEDYNKTLSEIPDKVIHVK